MTDPINPPYTAAKMHAYALVVGDAMCAPLMDEIDALTERIKVLEKDCRTCAHYAVCLSLSGKGLICTNGDKYEAMTPLKLWKTT